MQCLCWRGRILAVFGVARLLLVEGHGRCQDALGSELDFLFTNFTTILLPPPTNQQSLRWTLILDRGRAAQHIY
jgi:hypothetical protein